MATLYHAPNARSLRVLWTLEELGAGVEVKTLPFPPREKQPDYLSVSPAGTIPALVDGDRVMTESLAICEYLAAKHGSPLVVAPGEPERAPFLEWLWYGESTLVTPLSRLGRVASLPVKGEAIDVVLADSRESLIVRLKALEQRLEGRDFLVAGRLTRLYAAPAECFPRRRAARHAHRGLSRAPADAAGLREGRRRQIVLPEEGIRCAS